MNQEVAVRFSYNIHIPSKYSPPLRSSSRLRQDSNAFWWLVGDNAWSSEFACARSWMRQNVRPAKVSFMRWNDRKSHRAKTGLWVGWARTWIFCSFRKVAMTLALLSLLRFGFNWICIALWASCRSLIEGFSALQMYLLLLLLLLLLFWSFFFGHSW